MNQTLSRAEATKKKTQEEKSAFAMAVMEGEEQEREIVKPTPVVVAGPTPPPVDGRKGKTSSSSAADVAAPEAKDDDDNDSAEETEDEEDEGAVEEERPVEEVTAENATNKEANLEGDGGIEASGDDAMMEDNNEEGVSVDAHFDEEAMKLAEASYSTRGRTEETTTALDILAESSQRATEVQPPAAAREKEANPTFKESFLSDSLTDEERRTRTRYLPNVEGMGPLRKQEIKSDLALARCMTTSAGVASTIAKKSRRAAREDDMMDVDESVDPSDEDKASEILRLGTRTLKVGDLEYTFPSSAFLAPAPTTNGETKAKHNPPNVVDCVSAFNPPRPPESVGPKKKHRMLRWERRPADIEVDLNTYRKTVQKTREELLKATMERDRIEMLDNHLRRHFLNHLECLNQEFAQISEETARVQQECVKAADLITSRTRSRGAGKSIYVMRDVLSVLRARGAELQDKGIALDPKPIAQGKDNPRGVGGVGSESFQPWDNSKPIKTRRACEGWTAPGDKVVTPYGEGQVVSVVPSSRASDVPDNEKAKKETKKPKDAYAMEVDEDRDEESRDETDDELPGVSVLDKLVGPRIAVRLKFGEGFFSPEQVEPIEDPASFSDARLAQRWKGLMDTAPLFGEALDIETMNKYVAAAKNGTLEEPGSPLNREQGDNGVTRHGGSERCRLLPFGSDLIPTSVGRGALVSQTDVTELDQALDKGFFRSTCILGDPENEGIPALIKESEEKKNQRLLMKARLRQLKNEVNGQRRIRQLNQRTYTAAQERAVRIESLVVEMRMDLRSLKRRLDEEVQSLGIDSAEAEKIMMAFYSKESGEESPFKRARNNSEMDLDTEDDDEGDEIHDDALPAAPPIGPPTQEVSI